jgi:hypothetical protein
MAASLQIDSEITVEIGYTTILGTFFMTLAPMSGSPVASTTVTFVCAEIPIANSAKARVSAKRSFLKFLDINDSYKIG